MTEIEQLQLQHKCEQLELIISHLTLIHTYILGKYAAYQRTNNSFKRFSDEEMQKDPSYDNKISIILTFIEMSKEKFNDPVHFACHAFDDYLNALHPIYKDIACKLFESMNSEQEHKDLIIKISGYKPKECCNEPTE